MNPFRYSYIDNISLIDEATKQKKEYLSKAYKVPMDSSEVTDRIEYLYNNIEEFDKADPTGGKALEWIVKMYKNGSITFPEDQEKVTDTLDKFFKLKNKKDFKGDKDINRYKAYASLAKVVRDNEGVKTKKEIKKLRQKEGMELIASKHNSLLDKETKLWMVTTTEAALEMGWRNTEWCVKDPKYFDYYGAPFFCITIDDKPEYLANFGPRGNQYMDKYDSPVDLEIFIYSGLSIDKILELQKNPNRAHVYLGILGGNVSKDIFLDVIKKIEDEKITLNAADLEWLFPRINKDLAENGVPYIIDNMIQEFVHQSMHDQRGRIAPYSRVFDQLSIAINRVPYKISEKSLTYIAMLLAKSLKDEWLDLFKNYGYGTLTFKDETHIYDNELHSPEDEYNFKVKFINKYITRFSLRIFDIAMYIYNAYNKEEVSKFFNLVSKECEIPLKMTDHWMDNLLKI